MTLALPSPVDMESPAVVAAGNLFACVHRVIGWTEGTGEPLPKHKDRLRLWPHLAERLDRLVEAVDVAFPAEATRGGALVEKCFGDLEHATAELALLNRRVVTAANAPEVLEGFHFHLYELHARARALIILGAVEVGGAE